MMKLIKSNKIISIIFICLICMCFSILAFLVSKRGLHLALIWNLILAGLPLIISMLLGRSKKKIIKLLLFIIWLLLFPNAIYVVTDFIHLNKVTFWTINAKISYIYDLTPWIELISIVNIFIVGTLMGMMSLKKVYNTLFKNKSKLFANSAIVGISLLSGYGIYIGRFLRFNSWDILNPIRLIEKLIKDINLFSISFTLLTAGYILFIYLIFNLFSKVKIDSEE